MQSVSPRIWTCVTVSISYDDNHYTTGTSMFAYIVCSIWPIDRTLSGATSPCQSEAGSNGNERVLHIPQISKAGSSPSDCFMSYPGHSFCGGYLIPQQRWSWCIQYKNAKNFLIFSFHFFIFQFPKNFDAIYHYVTWLRKWFKKKTKT